MIIWRQFAVQQPFQTGLFVRLPSSGSCRRTPLSGLSWRFENNFHALYLPWQPGKRKPQQAYLDPRLHASDQSWGRRQPCWLPHSVVHLVNSRISFGGEDWVRSRGRAEVVRVSRGLPPFQMGFGVGLTQRATFSQGSMQAPPAIYTSKHHDL